MIGYRRLCSVILIALTTAGPAVAQSRNGNVWHGVAHQPNNSVVRGDEKARGIAASPQAQPGQEEDILDRLAREMLERSSR